MTELALKLYVSAVSCAQTGDDFLGGGFTCTVAA